jgi:hypothetical protein
MTCPICDQKTINCDCTDADRRNAELEELVEVLRAEVERLKLTYSEREAIAAAIDAEHRRGAWRWADSLRGLLERTR